MNLEYDFKFELAKSLNKCVEDLFASKQYISKSAIYEMEQIDSLLDSRTITQDKHKSMCGQIILSDKNYLKQILSNLSAYILHKNRKDFNEANYSMDEIIKENLKYDKMLIKVMLNIADILQEL